MEVLKHQTHKRSLATAAAGKGHEDDVASHKISDLLEEGFVDSEAKVQQYLDAHGKAGKNHDDAAAVGPAKAKRGRGHVR